MPGAKGHQNEGGAILGHLTISPAVREQIRRERERRRREREEAHHRRHRRIAK
jgi:hypothetical protein